MRLLRVLFCEILVHGWQCLASRDPSTPIAPHPPKATALAEHAHGSQAQSHAHSHTQGHTHGHGRLAQDPPKPEALKAHIAPGGPLEKKIKEAAAEAAKLTKDSQQWSDTSREIETLEEKVVAEATKDDKDLVKENGKVGKSVEAGAERVLQQGEKGLEEEKEVEKEGKAKAAKHAAGHAAAPAEHAEHAEHAAAPAGKSSLLALAAAEGGPGAAASAEDLASLLGAMNGTYGQIRGLLESAEAKAAEAKQSATRWATRPQQEFQRKSQDASRVVDAVTEALRASHDRVSQQVAIGAAPEPQ